MKTTSRRHFLQATAVSALALSQFPAILRAAEPARKLKLGLIGCGWYGMVDVKAAFQVGGVEVIALCDVDSEHLSQGNDLCHGRSMGGPSEGKRQSEAGEPRECGCRQAAHGRIPQCREHAAAARVSDRRCSSIHRLGEAGHDRLRNRLQDSLGRSAGANPRQSGCGETPTTRIPQALETSIDCLIGFRAVRRGWGGGAFGDQDQG